MYTKEQRHEYYLKNKEKYLERNKKWRQENKKKFYQSVYKCRKKKAEKLKKEGIVYNWQSDIKRKILNEKKYKNNLEEKKDE